MFKENYDTLNVQMTSLKLRNNELKTLLTTNKDKTQQSAIIGEAKTLKDNFSKLKTDIKFATENLNELETLKH